MGPTPKSDMLKSRTITISTMHAKHLILGALCLSVSGAIPLKERADEASTALTSDELEARDPIKWPDWGDNRVGGGLAANTHLKRDPIKWPDWGDNRVKGGIAANTHLKRDPIKWPDWGDNRVKGGLAANTHLKRDPEEGTAEEEISDTD
ncbi:hypothetical protein KEM54_006404 [Ascosphaera aggregata]|nr:hypothetical protein KEM54_006404 [Ascosphaera aggregata]